MFLEGSNPDSLTSVFGCGMLLADVVGRGDVIRDRQSRNHEAVDREHVITDLQPGR